ncbi:MAG: hypothetical protein HZA95_01005 [Candidatus Vogelbacteria bacterium]|nr:hypothetical protein [Candidatus Vogelbacteria bacterium]
MEYPKQTRAQVEPLEPTPGVSKPYVWVVLWVVCLIIVGGGVWYFLTNSNNMDISDSRDRDYGQETISDELRDKIIKNSSARPEAVPKISEDMKRLIVKQSSAPVESNIAGLSKVLLEEIVKAASVRP